MITTIKKTISRNYPKVFAGVLFFCLTSSLFGQVKEVLIEDGGDEEFPICTVSNSLIKIQSNYILYDSEDRISLDAKKGCLYINGRLRGIRVSSFKDLKKAEESIDHFYFRKCPSWAGLQKLNSLKKPYYLELGKNVSEYDFEQITSLGNLMNLSIKFSLPLSESGLRNFEKLENLKILKVQFDSEQKLKDLNFLRQCTNLEVLILSGNKLNLTDLSVLKRLDKLRVLNLNDTDVSDAGLQSISSLKNLEILELDEATITDKSMPLIAKLPKLGYLNLHYAKLLTDKGHRSLKKMTGLYYLKLRNCGFSGKSISSLAALTNLRYLILNDAKFSPEEFLKLSDLTELRYLDLTGCHIEDRGIAMVAKMKHLKYLCLYMTDVSDKGMDPISGLSNLESLILVRTKVGDEGIAKIQYLPKLRIFYIGDFSVHIMDGKFPLKERPVTDKSMEYFSRMKNLEMLYLSGTLVTDKKIYYLKRLEKLKMLNLSETSFGESCFLWGRANISDFLLKYPDPGETPESGKDLKSPPDLIEQK